MLPRQQRRRHHDGNLLAAEGHGKGRAQCHFGLAEADVTTNQPVHDAAGGDVVEHSGDGGHLVFGFLIGKTGDEFIIGAGIDLNHVGLCQEARRRDLDELLRHFADAFLELALLGLPGDAAQLVEGHVAVVATIAGQQLDIFDRQVELGLAAIFEFDAFMRRATGLDDLEAKEAADAVIDMDHEVSSRKARGLGQGVRGLLLALGAQDAFAENVLLGEDQQVLGLEAGFQRQHHQRGGRGAGGLGIAPVFGQPRIGQAMVFEHLDHAVTGARAPAGHNRASAGATFGKQPIDHGLEQVGVGRLSLGGKARGNVATGIVAGLGIGRQELAELDRRGARQRIGMLVDSIEQPGLHRFVGRARSSDDRHQAGRFARIVIVTDLRDAVGIGFGGLLVEHEGCVANIIGQRIEVIVEKR